MIVSINMDDRELHVNFDDKEEFDTFCFVLGRLSIRLAAALPGRPGVIFGDFATEVAAQGAEGSGKEQRARDLRADWLEAREELQ